MGKDPQNSLPNLKSLATHLNKYSACKIEKDALEEVLSMIVMFNTGQEANLIDCSKIDTPEKIMIMAAALIKLRRPDVAEKALKSALTTDEEDGGLGLLQACVCFAKGEYEEASSLANELIAKFGESPILLNLYGISLMHEGNMGKAEGILKKAIDISKDMAVKSFLEISLNNAIACKRIMGEKFDEYEMELRNLNPNAGYFKALADASELFDQSLG